LSFVPKNVNLSSEFFERIARAGAQAPSGDNLQPWSFHVHRGTLLVRHDPERDLSLFNVRYLASFIALGAVLENIMIAASADGYSAKIHYFPDSHDTHLIASVSFEAGANVDPLVSFLEKRCTNRKFYATRAIDPAILKSLTNTSEQFSNIDLLWVEDKAKLKRLGQIVTLADRLLFENRHIHSHLFSTLRWSQDEIEKTRDGLPIKSLELGHAGSLAFRVLKKWSVVAFLNRFGFSKGAAHHSTVLIQRCSSAGLITAPDTSPLSFLQAGHAFQRVWLQATKENLALQPMTALLFLQLRSRLNDYYGLSREQITIADQLQRDIEKFFDLSGKAVPVMLFRLGFADAPSERTIRRMKFSLSGH
jgi:nitroreductase